MIRSILAVIAGSFVWTVMWLGSNAALMKLYPEWYNTGGKIESVPVLLFIIFRAVVFSVIAGYLTAVIARRSEIRHTVVLGILQLVLGLMATVANFNVAPLWYHIIFLVLLIPGNVAGGWLRMNQKTGGQPAAVTA